MIDMDWVMICVLVNTSTCVCYTYTHTHAGFDNGATWPARRIVFPATQGWSTYSSVRMTSDQKVAILFDTEQHNHCRTRIRNVTCVDKLSTVQDCIACAVAHKEELTTAGADNSSDLSRSFCPGVLGQYEVDNMGGASGVQPAEQNFIATVTSACGEYSWPESPDGMLFTVIDPKEMLLDQINDQN